MTIAIDDLSDDRIAFVARVVPRASRTEIVGWTESGELKIRLAAPPVDDSANLELVRHLAKELHVNRRAIDIASGSHSRRKRLVVPRSGKNRLSSFGDI